MKRTAKITVCLLLAVLMAFSAVSAMAASSNAVLSPQKLTVNGKAISCEKYNIDGSNYFKLRDMAKLLNGTGSTFSVDWDAAAGVVSVYTGKQYIPNGTELSAGEDKSSTAVVSSQTIMINGEKRSDLSVYNIGGNNFFRLRDLGAALNFDVSFDTASNTAVVETDALVYGSDIFYVNSVDGLMRHIGSKCTVYLAPGEYNITDWIEKTLNQYNWTAVQQAYPGVSVDSMRIDGEISIKELSTLKIIGSGTENTSIVVEPRNANVLRFTNCRDIYLRGITLGHTPEQGSCTGNVLYFDSCTGVELSGLDLYGCGAYGIAAYATTYASVKNTVIRDCSCGAMDLDYCYGLDIISCTFTNNSNKDTFDLYSTGDVEFIRCLFRDNIFGSCSFILLSSDTERMYGKGTIAFENCTFGKNEYSSLTAGKNVGGPIEVTNPAVI